MIVLMLALPVGTGVTLDVVLSSEHTSVAVATDELAGRAASVIGPPFEFDLGGVENRTVNRLPAESVPPGDRAVVDVESTGVLYSADRSATPQAGVIGVDLRTGVFAGTLSVRSGQAPATSSEVALTPSLAQALDVRPGSAVGVSGSDRKLRVSGIIANRYQRGALSAYVLPQVAGPLTSAGPYGGPTTLWLVTGSTPLTGAEQGRIERAGLDVARRDEVVADHGGVAGHPLPGTSVPLADPRLVHGLVGGMIILEVALLAGPAFAIGARRRGRELATLSVVGARRRDLVGIALVDGIILGLVAAFGGLVVGGALGVAIIGGQRAWSSHLPDALTVHGWAVAGIAALSVVAGLLAAIPSAWRIAARDRPEPGDVGRRRFLGLRPTSGIGLVAVLVAIVLAGTNLDSTSDGPEVLFAAAALGEIGLALLAPEILVLAGKVADRLPVWPRLALRDAARQHSAAVPAVAAIIAVVAATATALVAGTSVASHDRAGYTPYTIVGDAQTDAGFSHKATVTAVTELRRTLPSSSPVLELRGLATCGAAADGAHCPGLVVQPTTTPGCPPVHEVLQGGQGGQGAAMLGSELGPHTSRLCLDRDQFGLTGDPLDPIVVVADGSTGAVLIGRTAGTATRAALDEGRAVAFSQGIVGNGRLSLTLGENQQRTFSLPAVFVDDPGVPSSVATVVLPPALAARIPVPVADLAIYVKHATGLPSATLAAVDNDLVRLGFSSLSVETGFDDSLNRQLLVVALADLLLTVAAAVTSTALIVLDNQADLLTLEALGAAARGRRRLAAARAGIICLVGALFGTIAGIIPGIGLIWRLRHITSAGDGIAGYPLDLPWIRLAAVALAAPLVAVTVAALVIRTHPDLTRGDQR